MTMNEHFASLYTATERERERAKKTTATRSPLRYRQSIVLMFSFFVIIFWQAPGPFPFPRLISCSSSSSSSLRGQFQHKQIIFIPQWNTRRDLQNNGVQSFVWHSSMSSREEWIPRPTEQAGKRNAISEHSLETKTAFTIATAFIVVVVAQASQPFDMFFSHTRQCYARVSLCVPLCSRVVHSHHPSFLRKRKKEGDRERKRHRQRRRER